MIVFPFEDWSTDMPLGISIAITVHPLLFICCTSFAVIPVNGLDKPEPNNASMTTFCFCNG